MGKLNKLVERLSDESLSISREQRRPDLTGEQRAALRERQDKVNLALTRAKSELREEELDAERRMQARRDAWGMESGSRRLRQAF